MLYPGSFVCSYKGKPWWPLGEFFARLFGIVLIVRQCMEYPFKWVKCDHVRLYVGYIILARIEKTYPALYKRFLPQADENGGIHLGFHFTDPVSEIFVWKKWMTDPKYARIFRPKKYIKIDPVDALEYCNRYEGIPYDKGELLDLGFAIPGFFGFSEDWYVCSTGSRLVGEKIYKMNLIPGVAVSETLPCGFAHSIVLLEYFDDEEG